jgi:hypothetical protein
MHRALAYLAARLREPGTMRSLVWVGLSVAGLAVTEEAVAHYALAVTTALGLVSAAMPERSVPPPG